eukprot:1094909_1
MVVAFSYADDSPPIWFDGCVYIEGIRDGKKMDGLTQSGKQLSNNSTLPHVSVDVDDTNIKEIAGMLTDAIEMQGVRTMESKLRAEESISRSHQNVSELDKMDPSHPCKQ